MVAPSLEPLLLQLLYAALSVGDYCPESVMQEEEFNSLTNVYLNIRGTIPKSRNAFYLQLDRPKVVTCHLFTPRFGIIPKNITVDISRIASHDMRQRMVYAQFQLLRDHVSRKVKFQAKNIAFYSLHTFQFRSTADCQQPNHFQFSLGLVEKDFSGIHFCNVRFTLELKHPDNSSTNKTFNIWSDPLTIHGAERGDAAAMHMATSTFGDNVLNNYRFFKCRLEQTGFDLGQLTMGFVKTKKIWEKVVTKDTSSWRKLQQINETHERKKQVNWTLSEDNDMLIKAITYSKFSRKEGEEEQLKIFTTYVTGFVLGINDDERKMRCFYKTLDGNITKVHDNKVDMKPDWIDIQTRQAVYTITKGAQFNIDCSCGGSPTPIGQWHIIDTIDLTHIKITDSKVYLDHATMPGKYSLECVCKNRFGQMSEKLTIFVVRGNLIRELAQARVGLSITIGAAILLVAVMYRVFMEKRILFHVDSIGSLKQLRGSAGWRNRGTLKVASTSGSSIMH